MGTIRLIIHFSVKLLLAVTVQALKSSCTCQRAAVILQGFNRLNNSTDSGAVFINIVSNYNKTAVDTVRSDDNEKRDSSIQISNETQAPHIFFFTLLVMLGNHEPTCIITI